MLVYNSDLVLPQPDCGLSVQTVVIASHSCCAPGMQLLDEKQTTVYKRALDVSYNLKLQVCRFPFSCYIPSMCELLLLADNTSFLLLSVSQKLGDTCDCVHRRKQPKMGLAHLCQTQISASNFMCSMYTRASYV